MEYRNHLNVPNNIPFGIEIEIGNKSLKDIDQFCEKFSEIASADTHFDLVREKLGYDFACYFEDKKAFSFLNNSTAYWRYDYEPVNPENVNLGVEITTPVLHNYEKDWNALRYVLDSLCQFGAKVNENCGTHIHLGAEPFQKNKEKLFCFFIFYLFYEPVFYKFSENGNLGYLRPFLSEVAHPIIPKMITSKVDMNFLEHYISTNSMRVKSNALHFTTFNLNKCSFGSSFELRMFNGTLDKKVVQNYVNMVLSSLSYALSENFDAKTYLKRLNKELKVRKEWQYVFEQVAYADQLVDEFISCAFHSTQDKDFFYEQYSGEYLKRQKSLK